MARAPCCQHCRPRPCLLPHDHSTGQRKQPLAPQHRRSFPHCAHAGQLKGHPTTDRSLVPMECPHCHESCSKTVSANGPWVPTAARQGEPCAHEHPSAQPWQPSPHPHARGELASPMVHPSARPYRSQQPFFWGECLGSQGSTSRDLPMPLGAAPPSLLIPCSGTILCTKTYSNPEQPKHDLWMTSSSLC